MKAQFSIVACSLRDIGWLVRVVTLSQILNFGPQLGFNQDQLRINQDQFTGSGLATHREKRG